MRSVYEQRRHVKWLYGMIALALIFHTVEAIVRFT